jgi:hypothetical protein
MATITSPSKQVLARQARVWPAQAPRTAARLSTEQVWRQLAKASFAVLGYVTPAGEPGPTGWSTRRSAVGCMRPSLPTAGRPSTSRAAVVHPAGSLEASSLLKELGSLLRAGRRASACLIEIVPEGAFVTYGLGVSLAKLHDPAAARACVPMTQAGRT